jgi:SulP family sulfate permease
VLSFHSAAALEYHLNRVDERPLILRMRDVHYIDTTGLLTLEAIIEHRQRHRRRIILTAMRPDTHVVVERFGLLDRLGRENVFEHTRCAIESIELSDTGTRRDAGVNRALTPS